MDPADPTNSSYLATDCINGTLVPRSTLTNTALNFTQLQSLFKSQQSYQARLDPTGQVHMEPCCSIHIS